eukprot:9358315-Alexandrium_andersonii.AAC.1
MSEFLVPAAPAPCFAPLLYVFAESGSGTHQRSRGASVPRRAQHVRTCTSAHQCKCEARYSAQACALDQ